MDQPVQTQSTAPIISVKEWIITAIIMAIPLVNIVMIFVWAFGDNTNPSKSNWAKSILILAVISLGIYLLFFIFILSLFR